MATVRDLSGNSPVGVRGVDPHIASPRQSVTGRVVAITPSDSANLPYGPCRKIYVTTAGNIVLVDRQGQTVTITSIPDDTMLDIGARRVNSTLTTATGLFAVY